MTQLGNTFEGGTAGTTLTGGSGGNTGGASGDYFNALHIPSDGILQFDVDSYLGALAVKMATRTVSAAIDLIWTSVSRGSIAEDYGRFYFKTSDITTGGIARNIVRWFSGGSSLGGILFGNGRLYVTDETNAAVSGNSTTLLPANQWVRIEYWLHPRTDGTGSVQIKMWLNPASNGTPDWDYTISGRTYAAATTDQVNFGNAGPGANWPSATGFVRFDGIVTGASTWVGPPPTKPVVPAGIGATSTYGATLSVIRGGGGGGGSTVPVYGVGTYGLATYGGVLAGTVYHIFATSTVRGGIGRIQTQPTPGPIPLPYIPPEPPAEVFAEVGTFARAVYALLDLDDLLETDNQRSWILSFIGAIGSAFQQMDTLAHADPETDDPPWSILMDVDRIPDEGLAWFGQFMGVVINPNIDVNSQRQQIRDRSGWRRGTVPVIRAAVRQVLTGTQTVEFLERDTSPYHFNIATYSAETSAFAQAIIPNIVRDNKPAGLQFTYTLIAGSPGAATTYENLFLDFPTYADVLHDEQSYEEVLTNP